MSEKRHNRMSEAYRDASVQSAATVKAVFFDLNNTLHDDGAERFFAAVDRTCQHFEAERGIPSHDLMKAYLAVNRELYLLAAGSRDERPRQWLDIDSEIWARALKDCGYTGHVDPVELARKLFGERLRSFTLFTDVTKSLERLRGRYTLGLITNGQPDMQRATLGVLGLASYFPVVVISGEFGAGKPSVEIFTEAARQSGAPLDEAAYVGDSLSTDIAGASAAGMTAIWLNRRGKKLQPGDPQPDWETNSLSDLPALLKREERKKK